MCSDELERLVRFCHPRKILGATPLPGVLGDDALAALYGTDARRYRALAGGLRAAAVAEGRRLGADPQLRARLEGLPLGDGDRVLALGDSITDDLGSWAQMLAAAIATARPGERVEVVDGGLSGDTTAGAVARLGRLLAAEPAVAIVLLGTNDARRHGRSGAPMLVSHPETRRNLRALAVALRRCRRMLWVTPPPVSERRIVADPVLAEADLVWRLEDVAEKAAIVRAQSPEAVDVWRGFTAAHLAPDGLHPSHAGQALIAAAVIRAL